MAGNIKHPDWPYGPHPLTVGLELEFLVNPQLPAYEDENLQDLNVWNALVDRPRKAHRMLAQGLAENTNLPIAVQCEHGLDESCSACKHSRTDRMITLSAGSLLSVYSDHSIPASVQAYPSFNYNVLVTEWLSGLPPTFNGKWEGIEVNTTVYKSSDLKEGLPQLHQLIRGLRLVDMPVGLARGCSLHVHASYSDATSHSILLASTPEKLHVLQPHWRGNSRLCTSMELNETSASESDTRLASHIPNKNEFNWETWPVSLYHGILKLWSLDSLESLKTQLKDVTSLRCSLALCLRIQNHGQPLIPVDGPDDSASTIEFRYLQMVLDDEMLLCWARVLSAIMQTACLDASAYKAKFLQFLDDIRVAAEHADMDNAWRQLLISLGLGDEIPFWEAQLRKYEAGEEFAGTVNAMLQKIS